MGSESETELWGEQDSAGIDLARLRYNLTLTDEERLAQHQRAARFVLECMRATERAGIPQFIDRPNEREG